MHLYGTSGVNERGHLEIGGVDTIELIEQFGTPLYVYDVELIRERARGFKRTFEELGISAQVAYASKAFSSIAMIQLADRRAFSRCCLSGELYTAIKASFPTERIHFHGNNKSEEELHMALDYEIGCIVVDNFSELALLEEICTSREQKVKILLRVTPGIEAHTHDYILTGQEDSKFGFDLINGQAESALRQALKSEFLEVLGLHCHIGSQMLKRPVSFWRPKNYRQVK